ncbi:MAG: hypothetical protein ACREGR_03980 [Minisyncoccia bacterium]
MTTVVARATVSQTRGAIRERELEALRRNAAVLVEQSFTCCVVFGLPCAAAAGVHESFVRCAMVPQGEKQPRGPQLKTLVQALACTQRKPHKLTGKNRMAPPNPSG